MAALADATLKRGYVEQILVDPHHPQFMKALEWATDRGYGKVPQTNEHTGKDGAPLRFTFAIGERDGDG